MVRGDIGQGLVEEAKVPKKMIVATDNGESLIKMFKRGRFDIISYGFEPTVGLMKKLNIDPNDYEIALEFSIRPLGYAFHKDTPAEVLSVYQKALDELNSDGTAQSICDKYKNK